ncbi:hypothetical protein HYFRA_00001180 [Hymenoscyphus fraxineus]|uniref:Uncharacterized protein n=1 Tax=Hymenoscyphus fraxineus TaxID=746836 RepID=A0A9N9PRG3_9HELO|nr:hypothetical protein HYFRA_00001180 [Hymenoscyphus fraxineus]
MTLSNNSTLSLSENDTYGEDARAISRKFSSDVEKILPHNTLARAMSVDTAAQEAAEDAGLFKLFRGMADESKRLETLTRELALATNKLNATWEELREAIQSDKKGSQNLIKTMFNNDSRLDQSKSAKAKRACLNTAQTIKDYSGLFQFVPTENDYVHVITGVLTTIGDAIINHGKIGEGFHQTMERIGVEMRYCGKCLAVMDESDPRDQQETKIQIVRFFIKVLAFLNPYSKWCSSKFTRFKGSLDQSYYETHVSEPMQAILVETKQLERQVNLSTHGDVSSMKRSISDLNDLVRESLDDNIRKRGFILGNSDEADDDQRRKMVLDIGSWGNQLTELTAATFLLQKEIQEMKISQRRLDISNLWTSVLQPENPKVPPKLAATDGKLRFSDIELASRHLEAAAGNEYPINVLTEPGDIPTTTSIFHRLQEWMATSHSETLWLCGPAYKDPPSTVSLAAASIVLASEQNKIRTIAYRFHLGDFSDTVNISPSQPPEEEALKSVEVDRLLMMIYSLIRQMVWILPEETNTESDFTHKRFDSLDGNIKTLPEALNIFEDLLALMPALFLCIIDGIQLVDGDRYDVNSIGTSGYFDSFLDILRKAEKDRVMKVLLTSDGLCPALLDEENIGLGEQMHIEGNADTQDADISELLADSPWED